MRVKRGVVRHRRHKKIRELARGFEGLRRTTYRKAKEAVWHAGQNAFRDRRRKKRDFRTLWTVRINAACREQGMRYGQFINALKKHKIGLDRKVLSELAIREPAVFAKIVEKVKA